MLKSFFKKLSTVALWGALGGLIGWALPFLKDQPVLQKSIQEFRMPPVPFFSHAQWTWGYTWEWFFTLLIVGVTLWLLWKFFVFVRDGKPENMLSVLTLIAVFSITNPTVQNVIFQWIEATVASDPRFTIQ